MSAETGPSAPAEAIGVSPQKGIDIFVPSFQPALESDPFSLPMVDVPLGDKRLELISYEDVLVGEHELGHALLAYDKGLAVGDVTVVPGEHSRGHTIVLGLNSADVRTRQVIAAGGSIFSPLGNGSDIAMIDEWSAKSGMTAEQAIEMAKNYAKKLSRREWRIAAEILAYKKTITGSEIPALLARARYEAGRKETIEDRMYANYVSSINTMIAQQPPDRIITIVEEHEYVVINGKLKKYKIVNGERVLIDIENEESCEVCGQTAGHASDCKNNSVVTGEKPEIVLLPKKQDIFPAPFDESIAA